MLRGAACPAPASCSLCVGRLGLFGLNPALCTEIRYRKRTETGADRGVLPLTCLALCSVCGRARPHEGIRSEVSVHNSWRASSGTNTDPFLRRVTQTLSSRLLVSCCGSRVRAAPLPVMLRGGLGEPGEQTEWGAQGSRLHCCLVSGRQEGCPSPTHPLAAPAGSQSRIWPLWQARSVINLRVAEHSVLNSSFLGREGADK